MKSLRILFLAPELPRGTAVIDEYPLYGRLAFHFLMEYARAALGAKAALEFRIEDYRDAAHAARLARDTRPDVVGFSCYVDNLLRNLEAAKAVRDAAPAACIVAGGPEMIGSAAALEKYPFLDAAFRGESEGHFAAFLETFIDGSRDFSAVPNISFRSPAGIVSNPDAPLIEDLDSIPCIYNDATLPLLRGIVLHETSRGCYFRCRFCMWTSKTRRFYSLERVEADLKRLLALPGVKRIYLYDSEFGEEPERAHRILDIVEKYNVHNTELSCFMSFRTVDEDFLAHCRRLNFPAELPFGLQTTNREALNRLGRRWFDIAGFDEKLKTIFKYIPPDRIHIDLVYGLPGDNYDGFRESLRWCLDHGFENINFLRLSGLPGTEFALHSDTYGLVFRPEPPYTVVRSDTYSEADLEKTEKLILNFSVLADFMKSADYIALDGLGADWVALIEDIDACSPDWNTAFTRVDSTNIAIALSEIVLLPALDHLKSRVPNAVFTYLSNRWIPMIK